MKLIDTNWDKKIISKEIDKLLSPYDDGELFVEEVFSENILLDDNKIKSSTFDNDKGNFPCKINCLDSSTSFIGI